MEHPTVFIVQEIEMMVINVTQIFVGKTNYFVLQHTSKFHF